MRVDGATHISLSHDASHPLPGFRGRQLRRTPLLRRMVEESSLTPANLIAPLFVKEGLDAPVSIPSLPGQVQHSLGSLVAEVDELIALGVPAVILFGIPRTKDAVGSQAVAPEGIVQEALRRLRQEYHDRIVLIADLCLCEYTDHGHCGILASVGSAEGELGCPEVQNELTVQRYGEIALAQADAGADMVAPSGMMDGQVAAIRQALDTAGFPNVGVLAYAAKFASIFYGPFREAAESGALFGDRQGYQMQPGNSREALREIAQDVSEGATMVMVKPALPYLDIIRLARDRFDLPIAAYNVSGEYAMLHAAAERGWLDLEGAMWETLIAIRRAGADSIVTYFAKHAAGLLSPSGLSSA